MTPNLQDFLHNSTVYETLEQMDLAAIDRKEKALDKLDRQMYTREEWRQIIGGM